MLVYEISKEYGPAFDDFVAKYILAQIDRPGFNTLGEMAVLDGEHYGVGLLQYYVGPLIEKNTARVTWVSVPEEERGESNAWSLFAEMERRLRSIGINRVSLTLSGDQVKEVGGYFASRNFKETKSVPPLLKTKLCDVFTEKIVGYPQSDAVTSLDKASISEVRSFLHRLSGDDLEKLGIPEEIDINAYIPKLSFLYKKNGTEGLLLVTTVPEGGVILKMCRCIGNDAVKATLVMVGALGRMLSRMCVADTPVYIPCVNENTESALRKMNPEINLSEVWKGELVYD